MKNKLLLTLALGLAGVSSIKATTVEVFLTGSTAFRQNCYSAAMKLFVGANPSIYYADSTHGGDSSYNSSTASWVMSGNPIAGLSNIGSGNTLVVHANFTGSIQGVQTVEQSTPLLFAAPSGTPNGACNLYVTNTPTIGFSDASASVTPYPASGNYVEESVAVMPFVFCKSSGTSSAMTNISNVSWEQAEYGIPKGRLPLSSWSNKGSDTNTFIYMVQRTKDSGTRRTETAQMYYAYNDPVGVYIYDYTNDFFYAPSVLVNTANGSSPNGVVGAAGLNNANVDSKWGYGYVGGGDVRTVLNKAAANNNSIGYLSFADAKSCGTGNWGNAVSFNGIWPTAAGAGLHGNGGTNDLSPVTSGYYPCWSQEVLVHPVDPSQIADSKITAYQLGDKYTPGSFMGVFNAQTQDNGGSPIAGSIENEIELSKTGSPGATAIRLSDMKCSRATVGGVITPL